MWYNAYINVSWMPSSSLYSYLCGYKHNWRKKEMSDIVLSQNQMKALSHKDGPMMVLAGPGSGKTTVITYRIKHLIENYKINPNQILVITFTKAAAEEMKTRFNRITQNEYSARVSFGTFHSLFFRIMRNKFNYPVEAILKEYESKEILNGIIRELGLESDDDEEFVKSILNEISIIKNDLLDSEFYSSLTCGAEDFRTIMRMYEDYKSENGKIDFDDMLSKCYELITNDESILQNWQNKYPYILVDEFQDINKVQYECIKLLAAPKYNLFIVGDDDQSIYQFRGARPEFLLRFPYDIKNVQNTILNTNYRSTDIIISLCNNVISKNKNRYEKNIIGTANQGTAPIQLISEDSNSEALGIAKKIKSFGAEMELDQIAVIYRTNVQSRAFVDAFMDLNIPFQIKDEIQTIYDHFIAVDICSYLKLALDRDNAEALTRIINKPKRYINKSIVMLAVKKGGNLLNNILTYRGLQVWQSTRIEELIFYLNGISKRKPYDAYKYIRQAVGYDDYLREHAAYRKTSAKGLFEVLEELQESSKQYETLEDYLAHIQYVVSEIKSKKRSTTQNQKGVVLSTMHSSKGLEFDIVFLPSVVEGVIPHEKCKADSEIEEERRLLYVAMTRARKSIYLSTINTRHEKDVKATRFLNDIIKDRK